jgi:hypothetical protein
MRCTIMKQALAFTTTETTSPLVNRGDENSLLLEWPAIFLRIGNFLQNLSCFNKLLNINSVKNEKISVEFTAVEWRDIYI